MLPEKQIPNGGVGAAVGVKSANGAVVVYTSPLGAALALGVSLGAALGVSLGTALSVSLGAALGVSLGFIIGAALGVGTETGANGAKSIIGAANVGASGANAVFTDGNVVGDDVGAIVGVLVGSEVEGAAVSGTLGAKLGGTNRLG